LEEQRSRGTEEQRSREATGQYEIRFWENQSVCCCWLQKDREREKYGGGGTKVIAHPSHRCVSHCLWESRQQSVSNKRNKCPRSRFALSSEESHRLAHRRPLHVQRAPEVQRPSQNMSNMMRTLISDKTLPIGHIKDTEARARPFLFSSFPSLSLTLSHSPIAPSLPPPPPSFLLLAVSCTK